MAAALLSFAVVAALLLSPPGAGADVVTWHRCKMPGDHLTRVFEASTDSNATSVWLKSCYLNEVRSGDFDGLPNVGTITLDSNSIAHVDPAAFRTVIKLRKLHLAKNHLREVPVFDEHSFCPSLTELYLSDNRITQINHPTTFSGCTELQDLHLDNNVIEYIHRDVFRPLSKLTNLDISLNKITAIPETLFIKNNKLNFLNLSFNKFPYLPSDFVSKLKSAGAPLEMFFFHRIPVLDMDPWHCACLLELLADVRRAGVEYRFGYMSEYNGLVPKCLYYGPYPCSRQASGLLAAPRPATRANSDP